MTSVAWHVRDGKELAVERYRAEAWWDEPPATTPPSRCHDCNVSVGAFHLPMCDMERCPIDGSQALQCECEIVFRSSDISGTLAEGTVVTLGLTVRWHNPWLGWEELETATFNETAPGQLRIPSDVAAVLHSDGFWHRVNQRLGTMFDAWEDHTVPVSQLASIAAEARAFSRAHYSGSRSRAVTIGHHRAPGHPHPITVQVDDADLLAALERLAEFLGRSVLAGKAVIFSL